MMQEKPTVLITGASRGVGAAAARFAAGFGANVVLTARRLDLLQAGADRINTTGGAALAVAAELSREDDCQDVIRHALSRFGRIDGLVNCGGIIDPIARIAAANFREWEYNWAVNVLGPLMLTTLALPHLRETRGRVINISSGAAARAVQGWGAYSVSKAALNHLTRVLAVEEPDITALAVRPGRVNTDMQVAVREKGRGVMAPEAHSQYVEQFEQGQLLPPEKPGRAAAWMALYAPHEWSGEFIEWNDPRMPQFED